MPIADLLKVLEKVARTLDPRLSLKLLLVYT